MFTPLDILYIVLSFCVLWLSAAMFWLVWQVANILKNINDFLSEAREKLEKIETAMMSMKERFDHLTSTSSVLVEGSKKIFGYMLDKHREKSEEKV